MRRKSFLLAAVVMAGLMGHVLPVHAASPAEPILLAAGPLELGRAFSDGCTQSGEATIDRTASGSGGVFTVRMSGVFGAEGHPAEVRVCGTLPPSAQTCWDTWPSSDIPAIRGSGLGKLYVANGVEFDLTEVTLEFLLPGLSYEGIHSSTVTITATATAAGQDAMKLRLSGTPFGGFSHGSVHPCYRIAWTQVELLVSGALTAV